MIQLYIIIILRIKIKYSDINGNRIAIKRGRRRNGIWFIIKDKIRSERIKHK